MYAFSLDTRMDSATTRTRMKRKRTPHRPAFRSEETNTVRLPLPIAMVSLTVALVSGSCRAHGEAIYVSNDGNGTIARFMADGTRTVFASGLNAPICLALDGAGNLMAGPPSCLVIRSYWRASRRSPSRSLISSERAQPHSPRKPVWSRYQRQLPRLNPVPRRTAPRLHSCCSDSDQNSEPWSVFGSSPLI
jgi:hypothetical protein